MNKCQHEYYKTDNFMQYEKAIKDPNICWIGIIERSCKDCGQDIEFARRVRVVTADKYIRDLGVDHGKNKGRRKRYG